MKHNKDELKIRNLFNKINTPQYEILQRIRDDMDTKRYKKRPKISVATASTIILLFIFTSIAFAAYYGTGGFQRLRGIVGDEHAEALTQIEVELGQEGFTLPVIPGYSPTFTNDQFRIEIVAISEEVEGYIDIYVSLEDITGKRATDEFNNLSFVLQTRENLHLNLNGVEMVSNHDHMFGGFTSNDIIHRCEDTGMLTLRTTQRIDAENIMDGEIIITFLEMVYNSTGYISNHPINFDFSSINFNTPYMHIKFDEIFLASNEDVRNYGINVLEPMYLDIPVELPGIHTRISGIGIISGNLHVQTYQPRPTYSSFSTITLQSDDKQLQAHDTLLFNLSADGTAYQGFYNRESRFHLFSGGFGDNQFQEYIWHDINQYDLSNLSLIGIFYHSDRVWLEWTTSFSVIL